MKVLFVFVFAVLAVTALAQTDEQKAKIEGLKAICIKETGVDEALILRGRKKDFVDTDLPLKKYISCMFGKIGFQDAEGNIVVENVLSKIPEDKREKARPLGAKCSVKAATKEETAYNAWKCFLTNAGEDIKLAV